MKAMLRFSFMVSIFVVMAAAQAKGSAIIADSLWYDDSSGVVYGYASTFLTYPESYWYDAGAESYLIDEYGLFQDDDFRLGGPFAAAHTQTFGAPGRSYAQFGSHYVAFYYYVCDEYCYY